MVMKHPYSTWPNSLRNKGTSFPEDCTRLGLQSWNSVKVTGSHIDLPVALAESKDMN